MVDTINSSVKMYVSSQPYFLYEVRDKYLKIENLDLLEMSSDVEESCLIDSLETPYGENFSGRLILIDHAEKIKPSKTLLSYLETWKVPKYGIVMLVHHDKAPAWSKNFQVKVFKKFSSFERQNDYLGWISDKASKLSLKWSSALSEQLFQLVGPDLYGLEGELKKLALLETTPEKLTDYVTLRVPPDAWKIVDDAFLGKMSSALNGLETLFSLAADDPYFLLLTCLFKQTERVMVAHGMLERNSTVEEISAQVGLHEYRVKNFLIPMVQRISFDKIKKVCARLCDLDVGFRSGLVSKKTALELAIIHISS